MNILPYHKLEKHSGAVIPFGNKIKTIKRHQYSIIEGVSITGDAPKALLKVYEYKRDGDIRKRNRKNWPLYIAKTGHKWYPTETLTEYLLNQLGIDFGLTMAESNIAWISGQLRFLSKFFLFNRSMELVHGAEIFAGYLGDRDFVERIEEEEMSRDLFTLQFIENSLDYIFPYQKEDIMVELVKMLLFDAFVGNNDRHFYNWGVVRALDAEIVPYFSPVYDTARGLFWNEPESKIKQIYNDPNRISSYIEKYTKRSRPKIGWEGEININHFKLVEKIYNNEFFLSKNRIKELFLQPILEKMENRIQNQFKNYFSTERIFLITKCLKFRYKRIIKILET